MNRQALHVVFGASGGIGNAVLRELVARNKPVRAVNRNGKMDTPAGVQVVRADGLDRTSTLAACADASIVYHCVNVPYPEWQAKFPTMTTNLIDGAASANAKLIFADNVYMYGSTTVALTEDLPYRAPGHKGKLRARLADMLMTAHRAGKVRVAIGRASDFYGPGVTNSLAGKDVFNAVIAGKKAMWPCNLDVPHTLTYIGDFARGLILLAERDEALGQVWHFADAGALTARQFLQIAFEQAGFPPNVGTYSQVMIRMVGLFSPVVREVAENFYQYAEPFVVDGSKFVRAFGFEYTLHRTGIQQTIAWYKANGGRKQ